MKRITIIVLVLITAVSLNAQKIKRTSSKSDVLKGQTEVNVKFVYPDDLKVGKMSEKEYIKSKMDKAEKDEAGKGEKWFEMWKADRNEHFKPMFIQLFNDVMSDKNKNFELVENDGTEFTMIVTTTFIEPGFNIGITKKNASVDMEVNIIKTDSPDDIILSYTISKSPGRSAFGGDFDTGVRIGEAYAKGAKEFAKFMIKEKSL